MSPASLFALHKIFDGFHKILGICSYQRPAIDTGFRDVVVPVDPIKVNSCAPVGVFCGLYSSVKTYRCRSAMCTTLGLSRDIHVGESI